MTISKVIHTVWVGDTQPPLMWMRTWKQHHPDWEHILWDNDRVFGCEWYNQRLVDHYRGRKEWAGVADVVRLEILAKFGGINTGADSECLHAVDELFQEGRSDAYVSYENEKVRGGLLTPLLACNSGNMLALALMEMLHLKETEALREPWLSTGNTFTTHAVAALEYPRLKIWPSHFFIPNHYTGERYAGGGMVYADHKWGSHGAYLKQ